MNMEEVYKSMSKKMPVNEDVFTLENWMDATTK